jgi:hypothetical protein
MKWSIYHSIWTAINTCLICLLANWVSISLYIPKEIGTKVDNMRIELDAYKNMKPDSIVINIDNYVTIPKTIKIVK